MNVASTPPSTRRANGLSPSRSKIEWLLKALAFCTAALCVYSLRRVDPDLWGYLAYGRLFVEHGVPVTSDPFAYTSAGLHWVTFEYLAQILLWQAFNLAGPSGLIALKCIVGGAAAYFLFAGIRATSDDASVWVPVFVVAISTVSRWFWFRPQLFSFAFCALYTAVLLSYLLGRSRRLWVLPVVMLAWANLHGGFLAGLGLLGVALALRVLQNANAKRRGWRLLTDTRGLILTSLASLVVTFVNPQGVRIWSYVLTEVVHNTNRRYIDEWRPTLQVGDQWTAGTLAFLTMGLVVVGWLGHRHVSLAGGLRPWQWLLSCVPLTLMAFQSVRHVPIATIWIAPVIALLASSLRQRLPAPHLFQLVWPVVAGLACIPAVLICYTVATRPGPAIDASAGTLGATHPCSAVSFMRQHQLRGNLFTPLWWGSYVTWHLYPDVLVSMDGRNISLFPDRMVVESLEFYTASANRVDLDAPFRHDTDYLLVPSNRPVLERVLDDARWRIIYADSDSALFVRADRARILPDLPPVQSSSRSSPPDCPEFLR